MVRSGTEESATEPPPVRVFALAPPPFYQTLILGHLRASLRGCLARGLTSNKHTGNLFLEGKAGWGTRPCAQPREARPVEVGTVPSGSESRTQIPDWQGKQVACSKPITVRTGAALFSGQVTTRWRCSATLHRAPPPPARPSCSPSLIASSGPPRNDPSMSCHVQPSMEGASSAQPQR